MPPRKKTPIELKWQDKYEEIDWKIRKLTPADLEKKKGLLLIKRLHAAYAKMEHYRNKRLGK